MADAPNLKVNGVLQSRPVNLQRMANLSRLLTKYGMPESGMGWEPPADHEIERYVAVEMSREGPWYKFADTQEDALASFYTDEGDWTAEALVDLDDGRVLDVVTKAEIAGSFTLLKGTEDEEAVKASKRSLCTYGDALAEARDLMSEGENPEYDRALAELLARIWAAKDMETDVRAEYVSREMRGEGWT